MIVRDNLIPYAFIHNPRTSGTNICAFLQERGGGRVLNNILDIEHRLHSVYAEEVRYRSFDGYFIFGFVRNPFSREFSLYNLYLKKKNKDIEFKRWLFEERDQYHNPQYGYFCDMDGKIKTNIFRFEERENSIRTISYILGFDSIELESYTSVDNESFNITSSYQEQYDSEMIDFMYHKYDVDFKAFGYTFEGYDDSAREVNFQFPCDPLYYNVAKPNTIKCINA